MLNNYLSIEGSLSLEKQQKKNLLFITSGRNTKKQRTNVEHNDISQHEYQSYQSFSSHKCKCVELVLCVSRS